MKPNSLPSQQIEVNVNPMETIGNSNVNLVEQQIEESLSDKIQKIRESWGEISEYCQDEIDEAIQQELEAVAESAYKKGRSEALDESFEEAEEISVVAKKNYDDGYRDAKAGKKHKPHNTQGGWCCACGYDIAVMKDKIESARKEAVEEVDKKITKALMNLAYDGGVEKGKDEYWHYFFEDTVWKMVEKVFKKMRAGLVKPKGEDK